MIAKSVLRDEARARRARLARTVVDFPCQSVRSVERLQLPQGAIVGGYWPMRDEADPRSLMEALGHRGHPLALPSVAQRDRALIFRRWSPDDPTIPGEYGIAEPLATAEIVTPDVLLVPMLAFDSRGHRLGYGGGYYDRTLAALKEKGHVLAVGFGFAGQEVTALPRQTHDQPLDMVVTELGIRQFG